MNIVIVEDDHDIALLWKLSFSARPGYECIVKRDVSSAIKEVDWASVGVAIVDMMLMGGETGDHLLRWLDATHPHVRTVLVTAMPLSHIPEDLRDRVMQKPSSVREISHRLLLEDPDA